MIKSALILLSFIFSSNALASDALRVEVAPKYLQMQEEIVAIHTQQGTQAIVVQGEAAQQIAQVSQIEYEPEQEILVLTGAPVGQYIDQLAIEAQQQTGRTHLNTSQAVFIYEDDMTDWTLTNVESSNRDQTLVVVQRSTVVSQVAVGVFQTVNLALRTPYVLILSPSETVEIYRPLTTFVDVAATLVVLPAVIASNVVAVTFNIVTAILRGLICLGPAGWLGACN